MREQHQKLEQIRLSPKEVEFAKRLETSIDDVISFNGKHQKYCVVLVDIVGSTKVTATLLKPQVCKYYGTFLNAMAMIATENGAEVVKNIGDSLLFYFPDSSREEKTSFIKPLECGMTMLKYAPIINEKLLKQGLPPVKYRISADYGDVMLAMSINSLSPDIFGPTVNLCTKINRLANPGGMVIGGDLYQIVNQFSQYEYKLADGYSSGLKVKYPVYSVKEKGESSSLLTKPVSAMTVLGGITSAISSLQF